LVTAAASWRHISSFGNFHWAGSQNITEILLLAFRNTRRSYKYWYLVRYLCWVQQHVATVTQGGSRRLFSYVQVCHVFWWRRPTSSFECRQKRMCIIDGWIIFVG
jgi:hypothetical protein